MSAERLPDYVGAMVAFARVASEISPAPKPDPLLDDLARLLTDPRLPDAYAESVRAELREIAYRMRLVAEQEAA